MPTSTLAVEDYDTAVEPWGPIKRRIVLRGPRRDPGGRDEATLLFAADRTETGVAYHVDDEERGVAVWAYFDADDYRDVLHVLERGSPPHLHYGYTSGSGSTRTLYFVSVETSATIPGGDNDAEGANVGRSLPIGAYHADESMDLVDEGVADAEAFDRIDGRNSLIE